MGIHNQESWSLAKLRNFVVRFCVCSSNIFAKSPLECDPYLLLGTIRARIETDFAIINSPKEYRLVLSKWKQIARARPKSPQWHLNRKKFLSTTRSDAYRISNCHYIWFWICMLPQLAHHHMLPNSRPIYHLCLLLRFTGRNIQSQIKQDWKRIFESKLDGFR